MKITFTKDDGWDEYECDEAQVVFLPGRKRLMLFKIIPGTEDLELIAQKLLEELWGINSSITDSEIGQELIRR